PLLTAHYEGQSGGSRAVGTRTRIDLGLLAHEACSELIALSAIGAAASPMAIWRPALPVSAGMKAVLRHARIGIVAERWFSQSDFKLSRLHWKHWLFTRYVLAMSRRRGRPFPIPEHTPLTDAIVVARWLAEQAARGTPGYVDAAVSSAVRVCLA